jgi:hypothetical protein
VAAAVVVAVVSSGTVKWSRECLYVFLFCVVFSLANVIVVLALHQHMYVFNKMGERNDHESHDRSTSSSSWHVCARCTQYTVHTATHTLYPE